MTARFSLTVLAAILCSFLSFLSCNVQASICVFLRKPAVQVAKLLFSCVSLVLKPTAGVLHWNFNIFHFYNFQFLLIFSFLVKCFNLSFFLYLFSLLSMCVCVSRGWTLVLRLIAKGLYPRAGHLTLSLVARINCALFLKPKPNDSVF